jgi:predicted nucleic-acid-binding protein
MVAIDTNIVVRLLVNDDHSQTAKASVLFTRNKIFIPKTVVMETEWVLRGVYNIERGKISSALKALFSLEQVVIEDETVLFEALDLHKQGMDLADAIHLVSSRRAHSFATFDVKLRASAKKQLLKPTVISP